MFIFWTQSSANGSSKWYSLCLWESCRGIHKCCKTKPIHQINACTLLRIERFWPASEGQAVCLCVLCEQTAHHHQLQDIMSLPTVNHLNVLSTRLLGPHVHLGALTTWAWLAGSTAEMWRGGNVWPVFGFISWTWIISISWPKRVETRLQGVHHWTHTVQEDDRSANDAAWLYCSLISLLFLWNSFTHPEIRICCHTVLLSCGVN